MLRHSARAKGKYTRLRLLPRGWKGSANSNLVLFFLLTIVSFFSFFFFSPMGRRTGRCSGGKHGINVRDLCSPTLANGRQIELGAGQEVLLGQVWSHSKRVKGSFTRLMLIWSREILVTSGEKGEILLPHLSCFFQQGTKFQHRASSRPVTPAHSSATRAEERRNSSILWGQQ